MFFFIILKSILLNFLILCKTISILFDVKVIAMNSYRLPRKGRRMRPIMGHRLYYKRMIITLQPGYSIPPLRKKRT